MKAGSNALEQRVVKYSQEIAELEKQKMLLLNWMINDKRIPRMEKKRKQEDLKRLE